MTFRLLATGPHVCAVGVRLNTERTRRVSERDYFMKTKTKLEYLNQITRAKTADEIIDIKADASENILDDFDLAVIYNAGDNKIKLLKKDKQ